MLSSGSIRSVSQLLASELEQSNHLAEVVDLLQREMQLSVPATAILFIESAATEESWQEKQDALQEHSINEGTKVDPLLNIKMPD